MTRRLIITLLAASAICASPSVAQSKPPLHFVQAVPLPGITGDFDHFAVDVKGNRLFLTAEEHKTVEVFDLKTTKHLKSIGGLDTPHSALFLPQSNKFYVVDGGLAETEVLDGTTYNVLDKIKLTADADSIAYDPDKNYLYVANGGKEAGQSYSLISIIDVASGKKLEDIKVESANVEAMALEKSGPRLYANMRDKGQVAVIDREKKTVLATWPLEAQGNTPMALDEDHHRLFVVGRKPGRFLALDTDSGQTVASVPSSDGADDMVFDAPHNRIYVACAEGFTNVFKQIDPDHYQLIGKVPSGFRGKTAILVPELNRYYVAVSSHQNKPAEVRVYSTENF
jgi:DNA-binding beta-propeller fold protein YncE